MGKPIRIIHHFEGSTILNIFYEILTLSYYEVNELVIQGTLVFDSAS